MRLARPSRAEELVQVELHRRVLGKLLQDPDGVRETARSNIARARGRAQSATARDRQDQWEACSLGRWGAWSR
jgi:hypothetical protein